MRKITVFMMAIFLMLSCQTMIAGQHDVYHFNSLQKKARFHALVSELRCVVCQNQSLAESNAPLASDLRQEVYAKIQQDWSDDEIKHYLVKRYGSYILFKPSFNNTTLVLWLGPFILLLSGFAMLFSMIKRQNNLPTEEG